MRHFGSGVSDMKAMFAVVSHFVGLGTVGRPTVKVPR